MANMTVFDQANPEDLASAISSLFLSDNQMKGLSFVRFLRPTLKVKDTTHKWKDDEARPTTIALTASGAGADWDTVNDITALPVPAGTIGNLRVGDMLLLPATGDEVVVIKSIDLSGNTIDLYSRGHGSTNGTAQGAAQFTAKIIGNAQIETGDPIDSNYVSLTDKYNYAQIFEDVIQVSGSKRRTQNVAGDEHDRQVIKKLKELLISLNLTLQEGIGAKDDTNKFRTMFGLRELCTTTYNVNGALTVAKVYGAVKALIQAGGTPTSIHASINQTSAINQLFQGQIMYSNNDRKAGTSFSVVEILGHSINLYHDRQMRDGEFFVLDDEKISYGYTQGGAEDGSFKAYPLLDKRNGKQFGTQLLGEYSLEVRNVTGAMVRAYGSTSS